MVGHPSNIGTYSVLSLLGTGGMGKIYLAEDRTGRKVALKVLLPDLTAATLDRLRFEREFDIASQLDHPNLVKVYERSFEGQLSYYSMEYVDGCDLAARFKTGASEQPSRQVSLQILGLFAQLASALDYLHGHSVIHRDLKAENVMVDKNDRLLLLDFGLACFKRFTSEDSKLTSPGMVLGTPYSMAPEQILGDPADERSDIYSLGVMLYQVFCQRLPFEAADPMAVLYQILHEPAPPFTPRFPAPRGLGELVEQLLSKEPQARPRDAAEVKARLELLAERWDGAWEAPVTVLAAPEPIRKLSAPRFIARKPQEEWFQAKLELLLQRRGCWALLTGASGVGKSYLLQHWASVAKAHGASALRVHPVAGAQIPYQLWTPILRWSLHGREVPAAVQPFVPALSLLLPELKNPANESNAAWDDPMQRYHLYEGMARLILDRCQRPALLLFDEVHQADAASLEFLHYFLETRYYGDEGMNLPMLVLAASEEEGDGDLKPLQRLSDQQSIAQHFSLNSFGLQEAQQFLESLLDHQAIDPETVRFLYQETEGKPLYLQEVAALAVERDAWVWRDGVWHYQQPGGSSSQAGSSNSSSPHLPARLRRAIKLRLDSLDEVALEVIRISTLLGPLLRFKHLQALCGMADRTLYAVCTGLVQARLLVERQDFELASQATAEVALESMSWTVRRSYHGRVAEYLETLEKPPHWQVANHWSLAGSPEKAGKAYLVQAHDALRSYAYEEACRCLQEIHGLPPLTQPLPASQLEEMWADALLGAGRPGDAIQRLHPLVEGNAEGLHRVRLLRKLATSYDVMGQLSEAHRLNTEALELLGRTRGQNAGLADAAIQESHVLLERENRVLFLLRPPGWLKDISTLSTAQLKLAFKRSGTKADREETWAQVFISGGFYSMQQLQWIGGARLGLKGAIKRTAALPKSLAKAHLTRDVGFLLLLSGSPSEARQLMEQARELSLELGDMLGLCRTELQLHTVLFQLGYVGAALRFLREALAHARRVQNICDEALAICHIAKCLAVLGDLGESEHMLGILRIRRQEIQAGYLELVGEQAEQYYFRAKQDWPQLAAGAGKMYEQCKQQQELPFFTLQFGLLTLEAQLQMHTAGGPLPTRTAATLKELDAASRGQELFRPAFKRLQGVAYMVQGKRNRAFEILGDCARRAELDGNPWDRYRCHTLLADWLEEEGLGEHHRVQAQQALEECKNGEPYTATSLRVS